MSCCSFLLGSFGAARGGGESRMIARNLAQRLDKRKKPNKKKKARKKGKPKRRACRFSLFLLPRPFSLVNHTDPNTRALIVIIKNPAQKTRGRSLFVCFFFKYWCNNTRRLHRPARSHDFRFFSLSLYDKLPSSSSSSSSIILQQLVFRGLFIFPWWYLSQSRIVVVVVRVVSERSMASKSCFSFFSLAANHDG